MKSAMLASKVKPSLSKEIAIELQAAGLTRDWEEFSKANPQSPDVLNIQQYIAVVDSVRNTKSKGE